MQGLMDIANEVNQKGKVAGRTPLVIILIFQAAGVFIYFRRYAITCMATRRNIGWSIFPAQANVMPRGCCRVGAKFRVRPNRRGSHRIGDGPRVVGHREDLSDVGSCRRRQMVSRDDSHNLVTFGKPAP